MTIILIFVVSVFTIFTIYGVLSTFVGGRASQIREEYLGDEVREIEQLVARREVLLDALRELAFEYETNKVSAEDYERFKRRYEREAVAIMRRLANLHGGEGWESRINEALEERLGHPPRSSDLEVEDVTGSSEDTAEESAPEESASEESAPEESASEESAPEESAPEESAPEESAPEESEGETTDDEEDESPTNGEAASDADDDEALDGLELSCSNCGKALEPQDAFCSQCGTPVTPTNTTDAPTEEVNR